MKTILSREPAPFEGNSLPHRIPKSPASNNGISRREFHNTLLAMWPPQNPLKSGRASSATATAGLLLVGIVVGAGLIFGTLYVTGSLPAKTTTQTVSVTATVVTSVTTVTTTVTSTRFGSFAGYANVSASAVNVQAARSGTALTVGACTATAAPFNDYIDAQNSGTANASITNLQITYGGATSGIALSNCPVIAGSSEYVPITAIGTTTATVGESFTGALTLGNGGSVPFSGTFS